MLSGEEFGRTKEGVEDSYCSPLSINRLDWERAYENADLVEYYRGLIALRKRLPGLCDKSEQAVKRMLWQEKKKALSASVWTTGERSVKISGNFWLLITARRRMSCWNFRQENGAGW